MTDDRETPLSQTSWHIGRALERDEQSLAWVVEHFTPLLIAQARYRLARHLRGIHEPEDLVNHVWLVCFSKLNAETLRPRDGRRTPVFLSFLSATLLRHYRELVNRHLAAPMALVDPGALKAPTGEITRAERNEYRDLVLATIDGLPERDREILILRGIEQRTYDRIRETVDEPIGTLRSRYHHAIRKLASCLPHSMVEELTEIG